MQMIQNITPVIGSQLALDIWEPSTTQSHPCGYIITVYDGYFGFQDLVYAKSASALVVGNPVVLSWTTTSHAPVLTATTCPTAIDNGEPIAVAKTAFSAVSQFGWFVLNGITPVAADSALAAGAAIFAHAAGRIGATGVGKQLVGINALVAGSKTEVKTAQVTAASYIINAGDTSGWFIGMPLTGTGVGSSAKITHIAPNGDVTVDVVSTATGTVSVTGTYNDGTIYWPTCLLSSPASVV